MLTWHQIWDISGENAHQTFSVELQMKEQQMATVQTPHSMTSFFYFITLKCQAADKEDGGGHKKIKNTFSGREIYARHVFQESKESKHISSLFDADKCEISKMIEKHIQ